MTFRNRPLHNETDLCPHQQDLDPDAKYFQSVDGAATEQEYLKLLTALVGIFKPSHILETGSYMGDGTHAIIRGMMNSPFEFEETEFVTVCGESPSQVIIDTLLLYAAGYEVNLTFVAKNTNDLMDNNSFLDYVEANKTTFAFLDSSIPDRLKEFDYISNPSNKMLDFTRPLCVCIHDMSKYRHPDDCHTEFLASTVAGLERLATERGWQLLRLNQSRGMIILIRYPN